MLLEERRGLISNTCCVSVGSIMHRLKNLVSGKPSVFGLNGYFACREIIKHPTYLHFKEEYEEWNMTALRLEKKTFA